MQLSVIGKQLDIGDALRSHVTTSLERILKKYFSSAIDAHVTLSKDAHLYRAVVSAHIGKQIHLEAHGESAEPYFAFDAAADRLSKRLRRHKRRLRDHHRAPLPEQASFPAQQYIIAGEGESEEAVTEDGQPVIVAEMQTEIQNLTVSEAVMRMDLEALPAMLFRNSAHGELNMIYRRHDGNIGWIDPQGIK